jgi:menaquinone-dependent protoporphyrinogen IX oxidase
MTMISRQVGRTTDVSRDHEYTDWADVEAFVDEFLVSARLTSVPSVAATTAPRP